MLCYNLLQYYQAHNISYHSIHFPRVIVGRRVLYNVDKIKKYIDAMAV